jgi:hypothetical protein
MTPRARGRGWPGLLVAGALSAASVGCVDTQRQAERALHLQAEAHVYHRPAPEIAEEVRRLLVGRGFALTAASDDHFVRTQWKRIIDDDEFASVRERYVVLVKRLTDHHCRVEAVKFTVTTVGMETYHPMSMSKPDGSSSQNTATYGKGVMPLAMGPRGYARDPDLEWELLRHVDAPKARRLEAEARR